MKAQPRSAPWYAPTMPRPDRSRESMLNLVAGLGGIFGFVGWATVAMGLAALGPLLLIAIIGAAAAFLQERTFWPSLVVETVCWAAALTVTRGAAAEFVLAGGAVAALARAGAWAARRYVHER